MSGPSRFSRFAAAVHRRAVGVRVIEGLGVGLAAGAGVAVALLVIGVDPGAITVFVAAIAAIGAIAGWNRRPTPLAALIEADQQLKTHDLLSTALLAGEGDFGAAVRAMAERAAATLSPSQVAQNRFGVRAWGGIGLAWAMVLVVGLLVSGGADSRASDDVVSDRGQRTAARPRAETAQSQARSRHGLGTGQTANEDRNIDDSPSPNAPSRAASGDSQTPGQAESGGGGGRSQSDQARVEQFRPGSGGSAASDAGATSAGSGAARRPGHVDTAGGTGASAVDRNAPPWQSNQWPAARAEALQAVQDGRVPDAYRDLVRDYFREEK